MSQQKKLHHPTSNRSENVLSDSLCKVRSIFVHYVVTAVVWVHHKTVMHVVRGGRRVVNNIKRWYCDPEKRKEEKNGEREES